MLLHKLGVALMISVRFFCLESGLIFPSTGALRKIFYHHDKIRATFWMRMSTNRFDIILFLSLLG